MKSVQTLKKVPSLSRFVWSSEKSQAALLLADGYSQTEVGSRINKDRRTIERWLDDNEFASEVDRLSLMTGIASRAERLRIVRQVVRQKMSDDGIIKTDKDILEWLKFAQGETDGQKLDITALTAALGLAEAPVAERGPLRICEDAQENRTT